MPDFTNALLDEMGKISHAYALQSCGRPSQKSGSRYSCKGRTNLTLMPINSKCDVKSSCGCIGQVLQYFGPYSISNLMIPATNSTQNTWLDWHVTQLHVTCFLGHAIAEVSFSGETVWKRNPRLFRGALGLASEMEASFCRMARGWLSKEPRLTW